MHFKVVNLFTGIGTIFIFCFIFSVVRFTFLKGDLINAMIITHIELKRGQSIAKNELRVQWDVAEDKSSITLDKYLFSNGPILSSSWNILLRFSLMALN